MTKGICVSDGLKDYFFQKYGKEFSVVRNFATRLQAEPNEARLKPGQLEEAGLQTVPSNEKIILYQGALNEGRGLELLIQAMQSVNAKLFLAGEGDLSEMLRKMMSDLKLEGKVVFMGFVSPDDLKLLTRKSYIGINLLEARSKNYYHSLANKFFDYTEAGVPSVNMNFPEYEKFNREFEVSVLINNLTQEKISETLNNLLNNEQLYLRLQTNCLKARKVWNWEMEKEKLIKVFKEIN